MLMKLSHRPAHVSELAVYDVAHAPGVAADLSHIDTDCKVTGYNGLGELGDALKGSKIVIIPAGVPRKPGMTRDDLYNTKKLFGVTTLYVVRARTFISAAKSLDPKQIS